MDGPSSLPVTTHLLRPDQRVRLMRSTRKMEHLLGETPLFIDTNSPITGNFSAPQSRRSAFIYVAAPARSSSLNVYTPPEPDSAEASTSQIPARPLLAVRVRPPTDTEPSITSSPLVSSFTLPPKSPADEQRRQRTRKMARIVRTLGENVPAELVFPGNSPMGRPRRTSTLSKRRSARLLRASSNAARGRQDSLTNTNEEEREAAAAGAAGLEAIVDSDSESASVYSALSGGDWELPSLPLAIPMSMSGTAAGPSVTRASPPADSRSAPLAHRAYAPTASSPSKPRAPASAPSPSREYSPSTSRAPAPPDHRGYASSSPRGPAPASAYSPSESRAPALSIPRGAPPHVSSPFTPTQSSPTRNSPTRNSPSTPRPAPSPTSTSTSPSPSSTTSSSSPPVSFPPGLSGFGYDRGTHRTEKGWSGEWVATGSSGVQNMDEVANRLRGLKLR
ncbi:hypothetical protein K438DRAFT_1969217 [Mycena galopus ATCC 62051]|nr:hypothetical protein K438DRAFT_1969217 [Mycena galopus ATCC 62051]